MGCELYVNEDNPVYLSGLKDENGVYINTATVLFTLNDGSSDVLTDVVMEYVEDSDGVYRGVIETDDYVVVVDTEYTLTITAEWGTFNTEFTETYTGVVRTRSYGANVYATCEDLEMVYGLDNLNKWADLNNDENAVTIQNRKAWALHLASRKIDDRLRGGPYTVPFDLPYPYSLVDVTAKYAGVLLYEGPRGIADSETAGDHALIGYKEEVALWIAQCLDGRIRLRKNQSKRVPGVILDE